MKLRPASTCVLDLAYCSFLEALSVPYYRAILERIYVNSLKADYLGRLYYRLYKGIY